MKSIKVYFEISVRAAGSKSRTWYHFDVNSTIQELKLNLSAQMNLPEPSLSLIFDGFLLENEATLAGLGVVDDDIIYVSDDAGESLCGIKMNSRIDNEFAVGLNVLLGETENGFNVIHEDEEKATDSLAIPACCITCISCIREIYLFKEKFNQVLSKGLTNIKDI